MHRDYYEIIKYYVQIYILLGLLYTFSPELQDVFSKKWTPSQMVFQHTEFLSTDRLLYRYFKQMYEQRVKSISVAARQ